MRRERDATYMEEARRATRQEERDPADVEGGGYEGVALAIMAAIARGERATMILNVRNGAAPAGLPPEDASSRSRARSTPTAPHPLPASPLTGTSSA